MDEIKKLYDLLVREGKYTKSFEEFQSQWSDNAYKEKVYDAVSRDGFYTKDMGSFMQKYGGQPSVQQEQVQEQVQQPALKKKEPSSMVSSLETTPSVSQEEPPKITDYLQQPAEETKIQAPYAIGKEPQPEEKEFYGMVPMPEKKNTFATWAENEKLKSSEALGKSGMIGMSNLNELITGVPEAIYNVFSWPQNAIAAATGWDISTNSEKFKKNLGIKNPALDYYQEETKRMSEELSKFNEEKYGTSSVSQAISNGDYSGAFSLLGQGIFQSAPTSVALMAGGAVLTPAQLAGASTVAFYGKEMEESMAENPDMPEIERNIKALGMAAAESVFSSIGTGQIGAVYKDIIKKEGFKNGVEVFKNGLINTYKTALKKYPGMAGFAGEGLEEAATQITQNLISGRPAFEGAVDAFVLGGGSGVLYTAPISLQKAKQKINDYVKKENSKKEISSILDGKDVELNNVFNVSKDDAITPEQIKIANTDKSRDIIKSDLEYKIKKGEMTPEDAKQAMYIFDKVQRVAGMVRDLDVDDADKANIVNLLNERNNISESIKGKDDVLIEPQKKRIDEINNEIRTLASKPRTVVGVEPRYSIDGVDYGKKEWMDKIGSMNQEQLKSAKIKADNAEKDAVDFLNEKTKYINVTPEVKMMPEGAEVITKKQEDAVQEQATGQVPVQPTTGVGQQVEERKPETGPEVVTEEGIEETITPKEEVGQIGQFLVEGISGDVGGYESYSEKKAGDLRNKFYTSDAKDKFTSSDGVKMQGALIERESKDGNERIITLGINKTDLQGGIYDHVGRSAYYSVSVSVPKDSKTTAEDVKQMLVDKAAQIAKESKKQKPDLQGISASALRATSKEVTMPKIEAKVEAEVTPTVLTNVENTSTALESVPVEEKMDLEFTQEDGTVSPVNGNERMLSDMYHKAMALPEDQRTEPQKQVVSLVEQSLSNEIEVERLERELAKPEVIVEEKVDALKDVESTNKAIDSLPDKDFNMLAEIKNRKFNEAADKELTDDLPTDEYNKKFKELQSKYDADLFIGEAYHKAKKDGSNPELVKAVEELLAPKGVAKTTVGISISNDTDIENLKNTTKSKAQAARTESEKKSAETKVKILETAQRAIKAIKNIFPDIDIVIHDNEESYNNEVRRLQGQEGSRGNFAIITDANGKETRRIDINLSKANERTVAHETGHSLLEIAFGDDPKLFQRFKDAISKILSAEKNEELNKFIERYTNKEVRPEEYLAELTGMLEQQEATLSIKPSTLQKIAELINKFVSAITNGKFVPFRNVKDTKEIVEFLNTISGAIREGKEVQLKNKGKYGGVSVISKSQETVKDIDVKNVRTKGRPGKKVSKGLAVYTRDKKKVVEEAKDLSLEYVKENAPQIFIDNANILASYPIISGVKKFGKINTINQAQEVYDIFIKETSDNLKYLTSEFKPDYRDIATLWYDGANIIAQDFAKTYGVSEEQAAGIIASLSPQKDWYQNVRLAEMVMMSFKDNPTFTSQMIEKQRSVIKEGEKPKLKAIKKAEDKYKQNKNKKNLEDLSAKKKAHAIYMDKANKIISMLESFKGKTLNEVPAYVKPYIVRLYHEINTTKDYNVLRPDGGVMGVAMNKDGTAKAKVAWGSYTEIGKAVSIYLDGSQENITRTLGEMHKIRNFYNNIIDPMSKDNDVTMDTHAVAAALLMPLSGNSKEVGQNFGTGTSNSGPLGIKGLYYAFAEGYKKAAEDLNLLPRQVQSITWEAIRGMFTNTFKANKNEVAKIKNIWDNYVNNKIDINETRKQINESAGGIKDPTWATSGRGPVQAELGGVSEGRDIGRGGAVSERPSIGARPGKGGGVKSKSQQPEPTPAPKYVRDISVLITPATVRGFDTRTERIKDMSIKYDKLVKEYASDKSEEKRIQIKELEDQILNDAKQEVIDEVNKIPGLAVKFEQPRIGLWDGAFEPSFNMTFSVTPQADTNKISDLLINFGEKYSQDAFILETQSEQHNDFVNGKIRMPLNEEDSNGLSNYPQIIYTFAQPISDDKISELSTSLQSNGIDAFSVNNNELKISVLSELTKEQEQTLSKDEQYAEKFRDFESRSDAAENSVGDVLGSNALNGREVVIKKSYYKGAVNQKSTEPTRQYDRGDILKPFQQGTTEVEALSKEFSTLRKKQIEGKKLTEQEQARFNELESIIQPVVEKTFEANKKIYEQAKKEVEDVAEKSIEEFDASISPFPIKRPQRASVKTLRWYNGLTENLGDGARVNVIVKTDADADVLFDKINEENPVGNDKDLRRINEETDLSYPKRLIEVRTPSGVIAEMQVITEKAYLAKDGMKGFTGGKEQQASAKKELNNVRSILGWNIPDGLGHYFYEIQRDTNIDQDLRDEAKRLSNLYYDAFVNENSDLKETPFMNDLMKFKERVDKANKKNWDKGNEGKAPESLSGYKVKSKSSLAGKDINNVIKRGRAAGVSERAIRTVLKKQGFTDAEIDAAMGVQKATAKPIAEEKITDIKNAVQRIKDLTRGAKDAKSAWVKASRMVYDFVKDLKDKGKISVGQMTSVINRFSKVNMLNDDSIIRFVDYMSKVFADATYADRMNNLNSKISAARKNIKTKLGIAEGLMPSISRLFSIDPSLIPDNMLDKYEALVDMMSKKEQVLRLDDINDVTNTVNEILTEVDNELSLVEELADRFESYPDKVIDNGKLNYSATINNMVSDGTITEQEAELMKKYKNKILPKVEKPNMTDQEIEEEKKQLIDSINQMTVDSDRLPTREERESAKSIAKLIKTKALYGLTNSQLKDLIKTIDNINNGYLTHYSQLIKERMNAIDNSSTLKSAIDNAKPLLLTKMYNKVKSLFTRKNYVLEMIRRNPLAYIDQVFGNFKTKEIFNSLFEKLSQAHSAFKAESKRIQDVLDNAQDAVAKSFKFDANKTLMSKFKMMTYLIQLEYESNKGSKQVNKASDFIKATIKHIDAGKSQYGERDADMLQKILDQYADSNGDIDLTKLYNSFNQAEREAIGTISKVNQSLRDKAVYTASVIRGQKINPLTNYVHLNVLHEHTPTDVGSGVSFANDYNNTIRPSTKAKSLIERTGKVSPLNFDVFASAQRGANFVLTDFHLTEPIRTARKTLNETKKLFEEKGRMTKLQKDVFNSIDMAFEEAVADELINNFTTNSFADEVINYMSKTGYRAILSSTTRFISELSSNIGYAMFAAPKDFAKGIANKGIILSANAIDIMKNVGSKQITRIFPTNTLSGKLVDTSIMSQASGIKGAKSKNTVANKIQQIYNLSGKKYVNAVELISDALISTPDKMVMRPIWFGAFANEFKKITGNDIDFDKLANNDEAYISQNKEAIDKATSYADDKSVMAGATDNAFMGILKGKVKPDQSSLLKAWNMFNGFMTRFLIYEYITARTGVMAAMGNGSISRKQGVAVLAGVTTRMVTYSLLSAILGQGLVSLFSDEEDEEEDEKSFIQKFGQSLASSVTGLLLGRDFGNAVKTTINYGVEKVNEKYLDFLREGEYDPYKDAIQYSIVPAEKKGPETTDLSDLIKNMMGPFAPAYKTADLAVRKIFEKPKKKEDAIKRQEAETNIRIPLEIAGNLGLVPLYKDIRKIVLKDMYSSIKKAEKEAEEKKETKDKQTQEAKAEQSKLLNMLLEEETDTESINAIRKKINELGETKEEGKARRKMRKEEKKALLKGYESVSDMKRYNPKLYEETFGEKSSYYEKYKDEMLINKEINKLERKIKDEEMEYVPQPRKRKKKEKEEFGSEKFGGKGFGTETFGSKGF
jgi:hypothetical protein